MEFSNLGKHCNEKTCNQKDFLPFKCKFCTETFCLEHRDTKSHNCKNVEKGAKKAIVCPICNKTLNYESGQNENEIWNTHFNTECSQNQIENKSPSRHCYLQDCNIKLVTLNTYDCNKCGYTFCLKHRYEDIHKCKENLLKKRENKYLPNQNQNKSGNKKESNIPIKNEILPNRNVVGAQNQSLEYCEICGKSFHNITDLISHAERLHIMV